MPVEEKGGNGLENSILSEVKTLCNVSSEDDGFDSQLIPLINGQIMMAHQFGIGHNGFMITGPTETWQDWLGDNATYLAAAKPWLGYSVLLLFDPPDNGTVLKSYQEQIAKFEWMLRSKSECEGYVKNYVPEHADVYELQTDDTSEDEDDG